MSILSDKSKKMLVESMRDCMRGILLESSTLTSKQATDRIGFLCENATYEQLLNITLNPDRDKNYLPAYVLEGAVAILHRACLTGRRKIGLNAIAEGALKLEKETGAVITESMLNAAVNTVQRGNGLKIVRKILTEAFDTRTIDAISRMPGVTMTPQQVNALKSIVQTGGTGVDPSIYRILSPIIGTPQQVQQFAQDIQSGQYQNALDGLRDKLTLRSLNSRMSAATDPVTRMRLQRGIDTFRDRVTRNIPQNAFSTNFTTNAADTFAKYANQNKGSGLKWALGGAAAAAGLGYLYSRYKNNQQAQQ